MRYACLAGIGIAWVAFATAAGGAPPQEGRRALASVPAERLAEVPAPTINAVLSGEIAPAEFLQSMRMAPAVRGATVQPLQEKQYISHWLTSYECVSAGINEDVVGESSINGRCSIQALGDGSSAPTVYPNYFGGSNGSIYTGYYQAPYDSATCSYDNTDVSRYFLTWIKSPAPRSARVFVGAADYYKLWVNGALVSSRTSGGMQPWTVDQYSAPVSLVGGWNLVVFKHGFPQLGPESSTDDNIRYKYFSVRFASDAAGTPLTDLVAAFDKDCPDTDFSKAIYSRVQVGSIAHLGGVGNSQWRTDVTLANGTHMAWQYRLRYYREGNNSGHPDAEKYVEIRAFSSRTWTDALSSLFGITGDQKGYFVVLQQYYYLLTAFPSGYGGLQVKVYNQASAGTYGMAVPAVSFYDGTRWTTAVYGVRNGRFRSNFGVVPHVNAGAACKLKLTLVDAGVGLLATREFTDSGTITGFWQLNDLFTAMGVPSVTTNNATLYVQFLNTATDTYWLPYVTVNDGNPSLGVAGTSDPTFLPGNYVWVNPPEL